MEAASERRRAASLLSLMLSFSRSATSAANQGGPKEPRTRLRAVYAGTGYKTPQVYSEQHGQGRWWAPGRPHAGRCGLLPRMAAGSVPEQHNAGRRAPAGCHQRWAEGRHKRQAPSPLAAFSLLSTREDRLCSSEEAARSDARPLAYSACAATTRSCRHKNKKRKGRRPGVVASFWLAQDADDAA